jgi:hypothetical protein
MYAACMAVRVSIDMGIQMHTLSVVNSGPFYTFIPYKDFINTNRIFFSGDAKDSVIFLFFWFFMSFITLHAPRVLPLAHPREFNMEIHV